MISNKYNCIDNKILDISSECDSISFSVKCLSKDSNYIINSFDSEFCIVILTGTVKINSRLLFKEFNIKSRSSLFNSGPPSAFYIGLGDIISIGALTDCEIAICGAKTNKKYSSREIYKDQIKSITRGEGNTFRIINQILTEYDLADKLLISETFTPAGNWSSYPAHKHDTAIDGLETALDEIYYYRFSNVDGYAFQRVYNQDFDNNWMIKDGDLVVIVSGFHPVSVCPHADCYYLNVMVGDNRQWIVSYET